MRTKNVYISLSLFIIFIGSALLVNVNANTNSLSESSSNNNNVVDHSLVSEKVSQSNSGNNVTAYYSDNPGVVIGDSAISPIWAKMKGLEVPAFGEDNVVGSVKAVHDSAYMYVLFTFASNIRWIGVEFDANLQTPMESGHDAWVFGNSTTTTTLGFYGDFHLTGEAIPTPDVQNDVSFERIVNPTTGLTYIEAKRALDTHDTAGGDVVFTDNANVSVRFASSRDAQSHKSLDKVLYSFVDSPTELPVASTATSTTTSTSTTPLAVVKAERFNNILIWGSIGFFFNIILINMLIIYGRRSSE